MWTEMLTPQAPLWETVLRAGLVYLAVVLLIRLAGKRGLAEMSTFDIVVALLLAEIIGSVAMADDHSLTAGLLGALTLLALNIGLNVLVHRSPVAGRIFQGKSVTVIRDGRMAEGTLQRLHISASELDHAIRSQHGDDVSEVDHAELTPSGKLVLTLKPEEQSATKADIARLARELSEIRALLGPRPGDPRPGGA